MEEKVRTGTFELALIGFLLFLTCSSCATNFTPTGPSAATTAAASAPKDTTGIESAKVNRIESEASSFQVPYFPPPDRIDLCGEAAPLHTQEVLERFDREFTIVVYNHAQVYLWLKRMERYFPTIEGRLKALGLPDDLKYVAIAESDLLPNAASPKGAAGPWQFIPSTGSRYGLDQQGSFDQRFDFEKATDSAFRYLGDLHKNFRNWTLAIAAYNCGERRVQEAVQAHGVADYYHLKLPMETERYIMRILAIKAVLRNPARYGYNLPKGMGYPQLQVDRVNISLSRPVSIHALASAAGINYREFKRLNPTFRSDQVPAGTFEIKLPEGSAQDFQAKVDSVRTQPASAEVDTPTAEPHNSISSSRPAPVKAEAKTNGTRTYTVKKGDSLTAIARKFKVSADKLSQANHLKGNKVAVGQTLKIP
jgi:membrane-bound lytic murein transglycosylase D